MPLPPLSSPRNAERLRDAGPHLLTDGESLWPVVDGIPYLRAGGAAREPAVAAIQAGDADLARRILLTDRDRFAPGEPADPDNLTDLLPENSLSLREAMQQLGYGAVGDYFAHRWSSPTFLSGVFLLQRIAQAGRPVVEAACGIGHFLRLLEQHGYAVTGIDIVWSKLWLAKHFLSIRGPLVCADIEAANPLIHAEDRTVLCHDAFYFFEHKRAALEHLRTLAGKAGSLAVGHVHTLRDEHEAGFAWTLPKYQELTQSTIYGDGAQVQEIVRRSGAGVPLREAKLNSRLTPAAGNEDAAVGWWEGRELKTVPDLLRPVGELRLNPLLSEQGVRWPSEGWRAEYLADSQHLNGRSLPSQAASESVRNLSEKPASIAELNEDERTRLYRNRVLLNLPEKW